MHNNVLAHMEAHGIQRLPAVPLVLDGTIQRFSTNSSGVDGWYWGVHIKNGPQDFIRVNYGDWSKGISSQYISISPELVCESAKIEYERILTQKNIEAKECRIRAVDYMMKIWGDSTPPSLDFPYLKRKNISDTSFIRQYKNRLLIPLLGEDGKLVSLQQIYTDGTKRFIKNLPVKGAYYNLGLLDHNDTVYVTESFSNAYAIFNALKTTTYISFSAQGISDVVGFLNRKFKNITIIIVADNDGLDGVGQKYAKQCADNYNNVKVIVPEINGLEKCDISDVHIRGGNDGVRKQLIKELPYETRVVNDNNFTINPVIPASHAKSIIHPSGIISKVVEYYNKTSIQHQPGFAIQTALAFCSVVLARKFKTNFNHYSSLYFLNIGKSGSGKEHQITVIQKLLSAVGRENLLGASGYTSPGAITTALMYSPAHISLIDEFGDYLISLKDKTSHQRLVNRCLLQLFNRCDGSYIGEQYSKFSRTKNDDDKVIIKKPGITLLCGVQPAKFYANINSGLITDGFLGRFLIHESNEETKPFHLSEGIDFDESPLLECVSKWVENIYIRLYGSGLHVTDPGYATTPRILKIIFNNEACASYNAYADYLNETITPHLEEQGVGELASRWSYMVGSLSLIIALSRDCWTNEVIEMDVKTAISIVDSFGHKFLINVIDKINSTQYERDKNEFLEAIRKSGIKGLTSREIARKKPFYRFPRRERYAILDDLIESELISVFEIQSSTKPMMIYKATNL